MMVSCDARFSIYITETIAHHWELKEERIPKEKKLLVSNSNYHLEGKVKLRGSMLEPVLALHKLQSRLRDQRLSSSCTDAGPNNDAVQVPCEKLKGDDNLSCRNTGHKKNEKVNADLRFLLENDRAQVEEIVKKHSDELSGRLGYMEQQLELLLDTLGSKCSGRQCLAKVGNGLPSLHQHNPNPPSDASVSSSKSKVKLGIANTGDVTIAFLRFSKAV
ncbi:putative NET domain-containing protein [Senna tora]|uniref:Putative NET domain-containing protein n=1 Tax=Senna tora TaxID=362788 RepID=A0A834SIQ3_9FABA|nr:putative NET domain-containing protein [Senna tora]